jgi:hypothetical protein
MLGCSSTTPSTTNSFTNVNNLIIARKCTNDFCHYAGINQRYGALDMSSSVIAYWSLVDLPCQSPSCASQGTRVVPGDPDSSIMYLKVAKTQPPCGVRMPANIDSARLPSPKAEFSGVPLSDDEQNLIRNWIAEGAQNN